MLWQAAEHTLMPCPLSVICNSFKPPSLTKISMLVEPASTAFSINSFKACTGATIISPAAILFTTSWSRAHKECQPSAECLGGYWPYTLILLGT